MNQKDGCSDDDGPGPAHEVSTGLSELYRKSSKLGSHCKSCWIFDLKNFIREKRWESIQLIVSHGRLHPATPPPTGNLQLLRPECRRARPHGGGAPPAAVLPPARVPGPGPSTSASVLESALVSLT